ncbi:protein sevenless-like, partial [Formica exsecta]|uniref:protein sevenless-like n=1 Tax=Formica exsecta TaxID=72781 RepID=UPI00114379A2
RQHLCYVTFRWNQPEFTDEVIQGYTVRYCFIENQKEIQICDDKNISATILECTVHNLKPNATYHFQVRAHTKVGAGLYTDLIDVLTTHENPIPLLLMRHSYGIDILDLDSKVNIRLVDDISMIDATYSIAEHKIYWSTDLRDLMVLEMNKNNITKIADFQCNAYSLYIDWVARNLYWMEIDIIYTNNIIKLDLTMWENGILKYDKILQTEFFFGNVGLTILPSIGYVNFHSFEINEQYFH